MVLCEAVRKKIVQQAANIITFLTIPTGEIFMKPEYLLLQEQH